MTTKLPFRQARTLPCLPLGRMCLAIALLANVANAKPQTDTCLSQAETDLENSYCEVQRANPSTDLPHIDDFKKNPERIQRLLLKREAERQGIALPPVKKPRVTTRAEKPSRHTPSTLQDCTLKRDHISCGTNYYQLASNLKNNQLKAEAFSSHNQLIFPKKEDTQFKLESDYRYLGHIYGIYIHKMLKLGLGDSTMSFTKFVTVYWQSKMESTDFAERFRFMYNQLKIEKSRNQINNRYRNNFPVDLHQCMQLDTDIIVCDDMVQNWIYKRL